MSEVLDKLKFGAAEKANLFGFNDLPAEWLGLEIHGVRIAFRSYSWSLLQDLAAKYPSEWVYKDGKTTDFHVTWVQPENIGMSETLWEDENPDCRFQKKGEADFVIQRDFVASQRGQSILVVCNYELEDGFSNFLRWLLPKSLLEAGKVVMHSSCVVLEDQRARICLGRSGAGKTTIAKFAAAEQVLGDDMNLIYQEEGKWVVTAAGIGQSIQNEKLIGQTFPIEGFYILEKADTTRVTEISGAQGFLETACGFANLFWDQLEMPTVYKVQGILRSLMSEVQFYNLEFNLDGKVWQHDHFRTR